MEKIYVLLFNRDAIQAHRDRGALELEIDQAVERAAHQYRHQFGRLYRGFNQDIRKHYRITELELEA